MHPVRPAILGVLTKTPSGGGDMVIQNACLIYNVVTSSVCLRHNYTFNCGLTVVIGEKIHQ